MKKLNKLFLAAGSVAAIAAPVAAVVSCGSQSKETSLPLAEYVENVQWSSTSHNDVFAVTDGGSKNDQSFNQQTWEAVSSFWGANKNNNAAVIESASTSASDLLRAYQKATAAKTFVMSGFLHSAPLASFSGQHSDKAFVFVDGTIDAQYDKISTDNTTGVDSLTAGAESNGYIPFTFDSSVTVQSLVKVETWATPTAQEAKKLVELKVTKEATSDVKFEGGKVLVKKEVLKDNHLKVSITRRQSNIANLNFKSEQAGYLAGVAAAKYSLLINSAAPSVATFGGMAIPPVTSFMNGFVAGAHATAQNIKINGVSFDELKQQNKAQYFIGNFDRDKDSKVSTLTANLLKNGADVIMPVGAAQEFTVLDVIKKSNKPNARVIGVDTSMIDQVQDTNDKTLVLTSALKRVNEAITQTLTALYGTAQEAIKVGSTQVTSKAVLGHDYVGGLSNNWVGVADINDAAHKADIDAEVAKAKNLGEDSIESAVNANLIF